MKFLTIAACSIALVVLCGCESADSGNAGNAGVELVAEGAAPGEFSQDPACAPTLLKHWAYQNMQDYYLFYDQVPAIRPDEYASAAKLVEDLRVQPFDLFSRVAVASVEQEAYVEGKSFGLGAIWQRDADGRVKVGGVYKDSPVGRAGITRADELISINGVSLVNMTDEKYLSIVGTRDDPKIATWKFRDASTRQLTDYQLMPSMFDINTVLHSEIINRYLAEPVGYIVLDRFLQKTESELDDILVEFSEGGIGELILDLRYNGGGLVSVAIKLASQLLGPEMAGELLMEYRHNDKYHEYNFPIDVEHVELNLNLSRLIVLTTEQTASASELVISALSPYIDVITIGSKTVGKPYITFGNDFCGLRLHALQAEGFNSNGVSVYGGVEPTCSATDRLTNDFGYLASDTKREHMLDFAIRYLVYGHCLPPAADSAPVLQNDGADDGSKKMPFTSLSAVGGALVDAPVKGKLGGQ